MRVELGRVEELGNREVAVGLNSRALALGEVRARQQPLAGGVRLERPAGQAGRDGEFVERAPLVCFGGDEQALVVRVREGGGTRGVEVGEVGLPREPVVARQLGQGFRAVGAHLVCLEIGSLGPSPGHPEGLAYAAGSKRRQEGFFVEALHCEALLECRERGLQFSRVSEALGEVVGRARIVGIALELGGQHLGVAHVLLWIGTARSEAPGLDVVLALQALLARGIKANGVFVDDTFEAPARAVAKEELPPVAVVLADPHQVRVGGERAEVDVADQEVVGVEHPHVVGAPTGQLQRLASIVAEVAPRPLVDVAGDACRRHFLADHVDRRVGRACVDDRVGVELAGERPDRLADDVVLVADDHRQANRAAVHRARRVPG